MGLECTVIPSSSWNKFSELHSGKVVFPGGQVFVMEEVLEVPHSVYTSLARATGGYFLDLHRIRMKKAEKSVGSL